MQKSSHPKEHTVRACINPDQIHILFLLLHNWGQDEEKNQNYTRSVGNQKFICLCKIGTQDGSICHCWQQFYLLFCGIKEPLAVLCQLNGRISYFEPEIRLIKCRSQDRFQHEVREKTSCVWRSHIDNIDVKILVIGFRHVIQEVGAVLMLHRSDVFLAKFIGLIQEGEIGLIFGRINLVKVESLLRFWQICHKLICSQITEEWLIIHENLLFVGKQLRAKYFWIRSWLVLEVRKKWANYEN